ncbi:uncharacterized protein LOC119404779 [Rhipicephalus sanguineus]|nr:uncharacterized protein LOC119404779 [Rhipicephalus sanguineus]XP_037527369.1 uncharacterized protein LOC119404779 [Rhipicephalus sanguineus]
MKGPGYATWTILGVVTIVQGMGWNHDLSRPVRDDCCRDPDKCCPYGYRCDMRYRNCVRITGDANPVYASTSMSSTRTQPISNYATGTRGYYSSSSYSSTGRYGVPDQGFALSQNNFLRSDNCPTGTYCWDIDTCCLITHGYNNLWTRVESTCCTRYNSPNCQRVRGCRVTMGDQRYKSYRETFTRRPAYYGAAHQTAVPPAATVLALAASLRGLALYTSKM